MIKLNATFGQWDVESRRVYVEVNKKQSEVVTLMPGKSETVKDFFVRLTKELHLAHVFVMTSDSISIERVYSEAMLDGRSDYVLIDDFEEENLL